MTKPLCSARISPSPTGRPRTSRRALPYGRLAGRLYLPVDGRLDPAISEEELGEHLVGEVFVLHPAIGLIGFASEDRWTLAQLLQPPPRREGNWDCARPGTVLNSRLRSIRAVEIVSVEEALEEGREDIGSESPGELPRAPGELERGLPSQLGRHVTRGFASAVGGFASAVGGVFSTFGSSSHGGEAGGSGGSGGASGSGGGFFDGLRQWSNRTLSNLQDQLERMRLREITRLLDCRRGHLQ